MNKELIEAGATPKQAILIQESLQFVGHTANRVTALGDLAVRQFAQAQEWGPTDKWSPQEWILLMMEELGEAAEVAMTIGLVPLEVPEEELQHLRDRFRSELTDLGALVVAAIEQMEREDAGGSEARNVPGPGGTDPNPGN